MYNGKAAYSPKGQRRTMKGKSRGLGTQYGGPATLVAARCFVTGKVLPVDILRRKKVIKLNEEGKETDYHSLVYLCPRQEYLSRIRGTLLKNGVTYAVK